MVIQREFIQLRAGATNEQAADFTSKPRGSHIWWQQLHDGLHMDDLLEHRYGNDKWMAGLERREVAA
jgi:hypothetical protein